MKVQTYLMGKNYKLMCLIFDLLPKLSCDSQNKGCNVSYYHGNENKGCNVSYYHGNENKGCNVSY